MLIPYHRQITTEALKDRVSSRALEAIINGNLGLDSLSGQLGHDEYHFDNNAFEASYAFIEEQRAILIEALGDGSLLSAWVAFGRLTHTVQDLYAHSNYIGLWRGLHPDATPNQIDPLNQSLLRSSELHSGKLYYPFEALYFIPRFREWVAARLPKDSHAHMNLDSPESGENFAYAFSAAVKRTIHEHDLVIAALESGLVASFNDLSK